MRTAIWTLVVWLVTVASSAAASVTVAWDPSPGADGYRVLVGSTSGVYTSTVEAGLQTQVVIPNLTPGSYYLVAIAYTTTGGSSGPSNELQVIIPPPMDPACSYPLGNRTVSIFPTALQKTGNGQGGSKARLDVQVASPNSPVTHVAVRTQGVDLVALEGTNLTALAGLWFTIPASAGTYPLSVLASNAYGCVRELVTPYGLTVK